MRTASPFLARRAANDSAASCAHHERGAPRATRGPVHSRCTHYPQVAAAPDEVHGLLGQRAVATAELPLGSASVSARGEASAAFGPQGEGAIEGSYKEYQVPWASTHDTFVHSRFACDAP